MKVAVLIDGGHLRAGAKQARKTYDNDFIEAFARGCVAGDEYLLRILYYDSPQYRGQKSLPISGRPHQFTASDKWMVDLAKRDRFAVRRGTLAFRGWKPKALPLKQTAADLVDTDFDPIFEQKGVDMRVGLDIATLSNERLVDRIVLVSGDTDMIPAMKHARKAGVEVVTVQLPKPAMGLHDQIMAHCDSVRPVVWP